MLDTGSDSALLILTKAAPYITIRVIDFEDCAQVFDCSREGILCAEDACDALHSWYRPLVELQGLLVALHGAIEVVHLL